jgi:hypothetical protein
MKVRVTANELTQALRLLGVEDNPITLIDEDGMEWTLDLGNRMPGPLFRMGSVYLSIRPYTNMDAAAEGE